MICVSKKDAHRSCPAFEDVGTVPRRLEASICHELSLEADDECRLVLAKRKIGLPISCSIVTGIKHAAGVSTLDRKERTVTMCACASCPRNCIIPYQAELRPRIRKRICVRLLHFAYKADRQREFCINNPSNFKGNSIVGKKQSFQFRHKLTVIFGANHPALFENIGKVKRPVEHVFEIFPRLPALTEVAVVRIIFFFNRNGPLFPFLRTFFL